MALVPYICPQCGGELTVDDSSEMIKCHFCGATFRFEQEIKNYNTVNNNNFAGANVVMQTQDVKALKERVRIFLMQSEFVRAEEYCEEALDMTPTDAELHFMFMMIEYECRTVEDVLKLKFPLTQNAHYKTALMYAKNDYKKEIEGYNSLICNRIYKNAVERYDKATTVREFESIKFEFFKVLDVENAEFYHSECERKIKEILEEEQRQQEIAEAEAKRKRKKVFLIKFGSGVASGILLFSIINLKIIKPLKIARQNFIEAQKLEQKLKEDECLEIEGVWDGVYCNREGKVSLELFIDDVMVDGSVEARFFFTAHPENPRMPSGSYTMKGTYDFESNELSLNGERWIDMPGGLWVFVPVHASVDIENGKMSGDTGEYPGLELIKSEDN